MYNLEIRDAIKQSGLFGYQVASTLGMSETSFSRALARREFTAKRRQEILDAIERMKREKAVTPGEAKDI